MKILNILLLVLIQTPVLHAQPELVITLGTDCSGTFAGFPPLKKSYYENFCQPLLEISRNRTVKLAVIPIGNPSQAAAHRLTLLGPVTKKPTSMSEALLIKKQNQQIQERNLRQMEEFLNSLDFLASEEPHQHTDLNGFFRKTQQFVQEPTIANDAQRVVFIYSDGYHDVDGNTECQYFLADNVTVYVAGWQNEAGCLTQQQVFESPMGFISFIEQNF